MSPLPIRKLAGAVRRRWEGLVFWGLTAALAPLCAALCRHAPPHCPGPTETRRRRWDCFRREGLRALRETWWVPLTLEKVAHVWRYVFFCELLDRRGRPAYPAQHGKAVETILVVNLGHLGDLLHTVPLLRALRKRRPAARLVLLTGPWNRSLTARLPYVSETLFYAPRWDALSRGHAEARRHWGRELRQLLDLADLRSDVMISCSSGSLIDLTLALAAQPRRWIGADCRVGDLYQPDVAWTAVPYETRSYEAERLLGLARAAGVEDSDGHLEFAVTEEDRQRARELLAGQATRGGPCVVLAPGAGWTGKQWPTESFAEVARWLVDTLQASVWVVGSKSEEGLGARIVASPSPGLLNLAGRTSVGELAALLETCDLFIGSDSGPLHLAAALGRPTVSLFGPGFPEKWAPRGAQHRALHHPSGCPCFPWHPAAKCERVNRCIDAVTVDEVKQAAGELLAQQPASLQPRINAN